MVEEIYQEFERKRAEIFKQAEAKEKLTPEENKEILRQTISEYFEKIQPISASQRKAIIQKAQQIKGQPKERQIQLLVKLAFDKGVIEAVEVAKGLDNPYLVDELHDVLVDEFYNKLVEQGKLEKI